MKDNNKEIKDDLSELNDSLSELAKKLKPLINFDEMEKQINELKDIMPNLKNKEGETCMHGNSWHSECSLCNNNSLIDDIFELVESTPNDSELGAKMRELYNSYTNNSDDTED